jgi:dihydroneopterin aldolase / 2-amino-4-hydroxy-6-hydroxymethyldihydropteridine diphosphokinase / dihydropteroate synthase
MASPALDKIIVDGLRVECVVGCNPDERVRTQLVLATLTLFVDMSECGRSDALEDTVNYSLIAKRAVALCKESKAYTLEALSTQLARAVLLETPGCERVRRVGVRLEKPEALKLARFPAVDIERDRAFFEADDRRRGVLDRTVGLPRAGPPPPAAAAGASPHVPPPSTGCGEEAAADVGEAGVLAYLALGSNLGLRAANIQEALRRLESSCPSPAVLRVVDTSFLYETPPQYVLDQPAFLNAACAVRTTLSAEALLRHIKENVEGPMGREKGVRFGARCIDVDILFYGPSAAVDVPDGVVADLTGGGTGLTVPHPRLLERDFALGPLADIAPGFVHPSIGISVRELLARLPAVNLQRVVVLGKGDAAAGGERITPLGQRTLVMGVLNITPDSFSDGGDLPDAAAAARRARSMAEAGADLLDVGGQSTRPGAARLSADEELARVLPALEAIRAELGAACPPVSLDTFYAKVAEVCVSRGLADVVNDVSAGDLDPAMLDTVARLGVPYVAMHMRGDPTTMAGLASYAASAPQPRGSAGEGSGAAEDGSPAASASASAEALGVVSDVRTHLLARATAALSAGVRRWNIVLDPGLGFAKLPAHSLALLRPEGAIVRGGAGRAGAGAGGGAGGHPNLPALLPAFPTLYGPSRKGFIGAATGKSDPKDRLLGTAAAVTAAIVLVGADIVRVHDVREMVDVVRVADAVARGDSGR